MLRRFRLEEPETVKDASELLARYGEAGKIYAGGTELLLAMKEGLVHYEHLINIKIIKGLDEIRQENGSVRIGALASHREVLESPLVRQKLPVLGDLEENVANIRVREIGTLGGNLCFAEPHADPGTLLLALGASLVVAKGATQREIPIERFFVDAYETCLEADELLTGIKVPVPSADSAAAYIKFGYLERPSVGVAFYGKFDGEKKRLMDVRIAVGCVGPKPRRIEEAEILLKGKDMGEVSKGILKAGEIAARASDAISDLHGSQDYKEHLVQVLLKRAFQQVCGQDQSAAMK